MKTNTGDRSNPKSVLHEPGNPAGQDSSGGLSLDLGPLISLYGGRATASLPRRAWEITAILSGLVALGYGVWRGYLGYTRYGNVAAVAWSRPWLMVGGAVLLLLALAAIRRGRTARLLIALHENGMRLHHITGRDRILKWDEVDGLLYAPMRTHVFGHTLHRRNRLKLILKDGQSIQLDDRLEDLDILADQIKSRFYPRLAARLKAEYQHGAWIPFGPLSIQNQGIKFGRRQLAWEEVRHLSVRSGWLTIQPQSGRRQRLPVDRIPNLEVCLALLQPMKRPQGAALPQEFQRIKPPSETKDFHQISGSDLSSGLLKRKIRP